jgi:hypothetical protein
VTEALRLRRPDVGERYGIKPSAVTKAVSRGSLPEPDGYDRDGAYWWASTLDGWQRPGRTGRPRKQHTEEET